MQSLAVIMPALSESRFIGETPQRLNHAIRESQSHHRSPVQVSVADNDSTDQLALPW